MVRENKIQKEGNDRYFWGSEDTYNFSRNQVLIIKLERPRIQTKQKVLLNNGTTVEIENNDSRIDNIQININPYLNINRFYGLLKFEF